MLRYFSISRVPFSAASLGLAALWLTDFLTFRPNRIAAGEGVHLLQTQGAAGITALILWCVLIAITLFPVPERWRSVGLSVLSCIQMLLLILTAGRHAAFAAAEAGPVARTSLGPSFWISLFALTVILSDTWQRKDRRKRLLVLMLLVTGGILTWMLLSGSLDMLSIMREFANRRQRFQGELLTHVALVGVSVGLALAMGFPLGLMAYRKKSLYNPTFFTLNTLQTVPSLALFGILIPVLAALTFKFPFLGDMGIKGIGAAPAIIALTAYSLLPIARNTCTGFETVSSAAIEAGSGMGMTRAQLLLRVEIPIASPVILNGIRVALVQAVGLTAVAALIGAGGLGVFIFQGLGQAANDLILLGAIPTIFIAVIADTLMSTMIHALQPRGLR